MSNEEYPIVCCVNCKKFAGCKQREALVLVKSIYTYYCKDFKPNKEVLDLLHIKLPKVGDIIVLVNKNDESHWYIGRVLEVTADNHVRIGSEYRSTKNSIRYNMNAYNWKKLNG